MATPSQLAANRANAQLSTGPKTEPGKQRARLNGVRHGLTGRLHVFTPEEQEAFDRHCDGIRESLAPAGPLELFLAQSIAQDYWRLNRIRAIEDGIFALGEPAPDASQDSAEDPALAPARTWLAEGRNLQLLTLYESRVRRAIDKSVAQLNALQARREAVQQKVMEDAQLLAQLSHMRGKPYDPAADLPPAAPAIGSAFSPDAVRHALDRHYRLCEAKFYANNCWDPALTFKKPDLRLPKAA